MKACIIKLGNWKIISICIGLFLFFKFYIFSKFTLSQNGVNLKPLDLRFSYTHEEVVELFTKLELNGRAIYKMGISIIDSIYPFAYSLLLISILSFLLVRIISKTSPYIYLALFPLFVLVFDFIENFNTISMLNHFPNITTQSTALGSLATSTKWLFLIATIVLIFICLLIWSIQSLKNRN